MKYFKVKEKSLLARVAAGKLHSRNVAMVLGRTIHLHGVTKEEFLSNENWLRHELKHIEQYEKHGYISFLAKYLWHSARYGYHNCRFEREARAAEKDEYLLAKYQLKEKNNLA